MSKYTTKSGQNIFDVSLEIFGSIEGVFDLLLSNSNISYETVFTKGMELDYHDSFIINKNIVDWFNDNSITVKNGTSEIINIDIKEEIKSWINNRNMLTTNEKIISSITENTTIKPKMLPSTGGMSGILAPSIDINNSLVTSFQWSNQTINNVDKTTIGAIKDKFKIDLSNVSVAEQNKYVNSLYSMGFIILPTDTDELSAYYDMLARPKIKIVQAGKRSSISIQVPANKLMIINWGDGSPMEFYHYKAETIKAIHTYSDSANHSILIYGDNKYVNLDFSDINGIYYALTDIHIHNQFITPYPKQTELNQLFIINEK